MAAAKEITAQQLRKLLSGSVSTAICYSILAVIMLVMSPIIISSLVNDPDFIFSIICMILTVAISLLLVIMESKRIRAANSTIRHLKSSGELDNALADLNGASTFIIRHPSRRKEKSTGNVLGDRFIFIFPAGRILHYYQITGISVDMELKTLVLRITDARGKKLTLAEVTTEERDIIDRAIDIIKARYPGYPEVHDSTRG